MTTMSDSLGAVIEAVDGYLTARSEHDKARGSGDGYDWNYFGREEITTLRNAESVLADALDAYVDDRIAAALRGTVRGP